VQNRYNSANAEARTGRHAAWGGGGGAVVGAK